ncbi:Rpn family recombination-promoting nuclease/putative transposase [Roseburia sp. 499]|uniref:Rpn family recombination-promoting nuclease/putative transposase n=1 Tax=Roseburia sp. 499 TaxID=1261634 RepID=UPI0009534026|nr:Rpn family recombination-promoting nuclease/putative transposase [Roseburia sp. 499]WVK70454.1 Rpn family recombination-promoting nuclease/putative transposase [Roseburia sp. 499]
MGEKDNKTLEYFKDSRRFADLINARFFKGKEVVKPENLQDADKELIYPWTQNGEKVLRDNVMKWMGNTLLAIFVTEHQSKVDYHMVFRIMLGESLAYQRQWNKKKKEHRKQGDLKTGSELLSGMKKEEKFCPVLSLVVYYGKEPYDGATNLREMLEWTEETNELAKYIPDYQINVFDYHNQKNFGEFHTELQLLFEFLRYASDKDALKKLLADRKKDYYNVDNETYQMIAMLTNSKELLEYSEEHENEEGKDMCQAIKEMIEDGRAEGIAEGIAQDKINVAKNLLDILSDEVIAEKVGLDIEVVRELRK